MNKKAGEDLPTVRRLYFQGFRDSSRSLESFLLGLRSGGGWKPGSKLSILLAAGTTPRSF